MKHFLLKFSHGVEIGARLAYLGHADRTKSNKIQAIAYDELRHKLELESILKFYGEEPNPVIDAIFWMIGNTIHWMCKWAPLWSLDLVARTMELFAIESYEKLSQMYPEHETALLWMAIAEKDHEEYFRLGPERYQNLVNIRSSLAGS